MRLPGTYISPAETGLYYLRSRYYCPSCCLFVNADEVSNHFVYNRVDNCYAYCNCCPTMYTDEDGFVSTNFDLGNGWYWRIDPPNAGDGTQRHIHVWKKGGPKYSQNVDGSPHDKLVGSPPKWVRDKLQNLRKWNWKDNKQTVKPTQKPTSSPSPSPSPNPTPAPGPAPAPLPAPTRSEQRQTHSSSSVNWEAVGSAAVFIAGVIWVAAKIAAAPYTGGLSLAIP